MPFELHVNHSSSRMITVAFRWSGLIWTLYKIELCSEIGTVSSFLQTLLPLIELDYAIAWIHHHLFIHPSCWWTCGLFCLAWVVMLSMLSCSIWWAHACFSFGSYLGLECLSNGEFFAQPLVDSTEWPSRVFIPAPIPDMWGFQVLHLPTTLGTDLSFSL